MLFTAFKAAIATIVIVFASWLAGKKPELAGVITALPLVSIVALAFAYTEHGDVNNSALYAKSIILAVPVSWLFFLPFFFTEKFNIGFWTSWFIGLILLCVGFFIHQWIVKHIL